MDDFVATTTAFATQIAGTLFGAFFGLLGQILPYAIGILVFYMGYNWARRALGGR
jgi:predicted Na+-dependent transporter